MLGKKGLEKEGKPAKETAEEELEEWPDEIVAKAIVEMLGAPKEYLQDTIKAVVNSMDSHPDLKVLESEFFEPKPQDKLFSTFTELKIRFKDVSAMFGFCIDFMPASIDIESPEKMNFEARELTNSVNDLIASLHKIDMTIKNMSAEKQLLERKVMTLINNNIILYLGQKKLPTEKIAAGIGIPVEHLKPILEDMAKKARLKVENENYYA